MKAMGRIAFFVLFALIALPAFAESDEEKKGVRYKQSKDINFEKLLIEGQNRRPEISVVTGNVSQGDDGLLRLRTNFVDRIAEDAGEEVK